MQMGLGVKEMTRSEKLHRIVVELNRVADMMTFYDTDPKNGAELYGLSGIIESLIQVVAQRRDEIKASEDQEGQNDEPMDRR